MMKTFIIGAVVLTIMTTSTGAAEGPTPAPLTFLTYCIKIQQTALSRLAHSRTITDLDQIYKALPYHDAVSRMVYAYCHETLRSGPPSDKILVESIPANPLEFSYCGELSDVYGEEDHDSKLSQVFDEYLSMIAKAVGATGKGYKEFLRLRGFADGSVAEELDDDNETLLRRDRTVFIREFMILDKQTREQICGDWHEPFCKH